METFWLGGGGIIWGERQAARKKNWCWMGKLLRQKKMLAGEWWIAPPENALAEKKLAFGWSLIAGKMGGVPSPKDWSWSWGGGRGGHAASRKALATARWSSFWLRSPSRTVAHQRRRSGAGRGVGVEE